MMCTSTYMLRGNFCFLRSLWLMMSTVIVIGSSSAIIIGEWKAYSKVFWSMGWARPCPVHLDDLACLIEPNRIFVV